MSDEVFRSIAVSDLRATGRCVIPQYTTTARNALTAIEGEIIYNTTTNKLNVYTGSAWEAVTSA